MIDESEEEDKMIDELDESRKKHEHPVMNR
jgi:hypothetical protein